MKKRNDHAMSGAGRILLAVFAVGLACGVGRASGDDGACAPARRIASYAVSDGPVTNLAWRPDGRFLVYCGTQGCRAIDARSGQVVFRFPASEIATTGLGQGNIGFSPDVRFLFLPSLLSRDDQLLSVWNAASWAALPDLPGLPAAVRETDGLKSGLFTMAAGGADFAAAPSGFGGAVVIYDLPSLRLRGTIMAPAGSFASVMSLSPDGGSLAGDEGDAAFAVYDTRTGRRRGAVSYQLDWRLERVSVLAYSPDGRYLAAGFTNGGRVQVPGPGETMVTLPTPWPTEPVWIWDVRNGMPYGAPRRLCGKQSQGVQNMVWERRSEAVIYADGYGKTVICPVDGAGGATVLDQGFADLRYLALSPDGGTLAVGVDGEIDLLALAPPAAN